MGSPPFFRCPTGKTYGHLKPGQYYRVECDFRDNEGRRHQAGQLWLYRSYDFLPYEDGLTLHFMTEQGDDLQVRLQDRADAEQPVIKNLEMLLAPCKRSAALGDE
jgi:hypothetical protein